GDEILRRVARILESNVRRTDRVARLGGDEFAILLPETDAKTGWEIGNRILASLRSEVLRSGGRTIRLDASIGLASFPQEADTVNDLLIHADLAMYEAKR